MIGLAILLVQLAADPVLEARVQVLRGHMQGLEAIQVSGEYQAEKDEKLKKLYGRFDAGIDTVADFNAQYEAMDEVRYWLWANAVDKPKTSDGVYDESQTAWIIDNGPLHVTIDKKTFAMHVLTGKSSWQFSPSAEDDIQGAETSFPLTAARTVSADPFHTGYSTGMTLSLREFPDANDLSVYITWYLIGSEMVIDIVCNDHSFAVKKLRWPRAIETEATSDWTVVVPRMQGILIPGDWPKEIKYEDVSNSRTLYMPWWGVLHGRSGAMSILESSDDGGARYHHVPGKPTIIEPSWFCSLGYIRYPRTIRYVFDDDATYVSMAKRYRKYVKEMGNFVTLKQKVARTPLLEKVIGRPVIIVAGLYHNVPGSQPYNKEQLELNHTIETFDSIAARLRVVKERGIDDAYVHLDGWGYYGYDSGQPDVLPPGPEQGGWEGLRRLADTCDELGWVFALHDQYRDFHFSAASFDPRMAMTDANGVFEQHAKWCGGLQTFLSMRFAPEYVRRNYDMIAKEGIKVNGMYIDVFAVGPPDESYQREHPVSRTDCMKYRRESFDLMLARGFVVSSEEPTDFLVRTLHLVHHGPYTTETFEGGPGLGISVPLFNLVYHDSIMLPWSMTERGGWGIPENDPGRLHCLLNAGLPYLYPSADDAHYAIVKEAAELAKRTAHEEMVSHEFLDEARRKQRTTFSDGTVVTVDLEAATHEIVYGTAPQP
ncbi:MAG: hypothetical protein AMXMBFR84_37210 [Candidatus Hydrogenedentota bacterium]